VSDPAVTNPSSIPGLAECSPSGALDAQGLVDYTRSLDCIHCGLCLHTCPTYQLSGREASSPRGRVHLMRGVAEGRLDANEEFAEEMDFCLVCRHCESACPAGVEFGAMMEFTRDALLVDRPRALHVRLARHLGFRRILPSRLALRMLAGALGLAQRTGLTSLARVLGARGRALAALPAVPPRAERTPLSATTPARGEAIAAVAMLEGCVMPELFGRVNRATATCLASAGCEVRTAPGHTCCGALHAHNGDLETARRLGRETIHAYDELRDASGTPLPVVVNSAGCGAHMKELQRHLADDEEWAERARAFSARVVDLSELLRQEQHASRLAAAVQAGGGTLRAAYDDPCHLCHGQGIRDEPRELLAALPGVELVELPHAESCCGSAGIYSLLRPADASGVLAPKLEELRRARVDVLVTANPGCQMQWTSGASSAGIDVRVAHLAELIAERLGPPSQVASGSPSG